ncbi:hypothetical protein KC338_g80 [Hortaea werneckii]|nr:hypothetical protein KC338_g80 [Hortaea werneckii]
MRFIILLIIIATNFKLIRHLDQVLHTPPHIPPGRNANPTAEEEPSIAIHRLTAAPRSRRAGPRSRSCGRIITVSRQLRGQKTLMTPVRRGRNVGEMLGEDFIQTVLCGARETDVPVHGSDSAGAGERLGDGGKKRCLVAGSFAEREESTQANDGTGVRFRWAFLLLGVIPRNHGTREVRYPDSMLLRKMRASDQWYPSMLTAKASLSELSKSIASEL